MPQIERALLRTLPWLGAGLVAALPLLAIDIGDDPTTSFLVHLSAVVIFGLGLSLHLLPLADDRWFVATGRGRRARLSASGVSIVVLVTGAVGLVTLATSAALRYDPSTQFLQLLSALDIAWAGAAIVVGATRLRGRAAGVVGGIVLGAFCIWTIANYLHTVGFGPGGEWIVRGDDLMRLVIVWDMAAGMVAVAIFFFAIYRAGATEQARPQS